MKKFNVTMYYKKVKGDDPDRPPIPNATWYLKYREPVNGSDKTKNVYVNTGIKVCGDDGLISNDNRWEAETLRITTEKKINPTLDNPKATDIGMVLKVVGSKCTYETMKGLIRDEYNLQERKSVDSLEESLRNLDMYFEGKTFVDMGKVAINEYKLAEKARVKPDGDTISNATINRRLMVLSKMFDLAIDNDLIGLADRPKIKTLKENPARQNYFRHDEMVKLCNVLQSQGDYWLADYVEFSFYTGWRINEVRSLKWGFIDLANGVPKLRCPFYILKNGKEKSVPIVGPIATVLNRLMNNRGITLDNLDDFADEYIFLTKTGLPWGSKDTHTRTWNKAIKACGFKRLDAPETPHDLRRGFVHYMASKGVSESLIMDIGGWKRQDVFERYNIKSEDQLIKAIMLQMPNPDNQDPSNQGLQTTEPDTLQLVENTQDPF